MKATQKNEKIARQIINLLAQEKVTVEESDEILRFARDEIKERSLVKPIDYKMFETTEE